MTTESDREKRGRAWLAEFNAREMAEISYDGLEARSFYHASCFHGRGQRWLLDLRALGFEGVRCVACGWIIEDEGVTALR